MPLRIETTGRKRGEAEALPTSDSRRLERADKARSAVLTSCRRERREEGLCF